MKNDEDGQWQDIAKSLEGSKYWPKDQKLIEDMKFPESVISKYKLDDIIWEYFNVHFYLERFEHVSFEMKSTIVIIITIIIIIIKLK